MKIFIGSDHNGMEHIIRIKNYFEQKGFEVELPVLKNYDGDDYPDFAYEVCQNVLKENTLGILLCGTGIGMSIAANKIKGIRCAKVCSLDEAFLSRNHNDANVLAISYKMDINTIIEIIEKFITTDFSHENRHERRIEKINKIENGTYN